MRLLALLCALQTPATAANTQAPATPPPPGIVLPGSPAARAFSSVSPDTTPAPLDLAFLPASASDPRWERPEIWKEWAESVRGCAKSGEPGSEKRARLCLFACAQGRSDDAWEHFSALAGEPNLCAALLPLLVPGVPFSLSAAARASSGGLPGTLPDGVLLTPLLPPPTTPVSEVVLGRSWVEPRSVRIEGIQIGEATIGMHLLLEGDGIQIELEHRAGPRARLSVLLPEPPDFGIYVEYVDWYRQDTLGLPHAIELEPGTEVRTVFGRFRPRRLAWPTRVPRAVPARFLEAGLRVEVGPDDPDRERVASFTAGLGTLLGVRAELREIEPGAERQDFAGLRLSLFDGAERARKLLGLVSLTERFALVHGVR